MNQTHYLIIRSDGSVRIVTRYPSLRTDEVAYRMVIKLPAGWGLMAGELIVTLPEGLPTAEMVEGDIRPEVTA